MKVYVLITEFLHAMDSGSDKEVGGVFATRNDAIAAGDLFKKTFSNRDQYVYSIFEENVIEKQKLTEAELQTILDGPPDDSICCPDGQVRRKSGIPFGYVISFFMHKIEDLPHIGGELKSFWNGEKWCEQGTSESVALYNEMVRRLDIVWHDYARKFNSPL